MAAEGALDAKLAAAGAMWGGADYDEIAQRFAAIHDRLVERLAPVSGDAWLDVATGTGEVALRAARAGADTTGFDLSPGLLEQARAKAERDGLEIRWDLGTAESLPYEAGAYDVVSSCFGVIFAPDYDAAAAELGRVCRAGGRLGLASWRPQPQLDELYARFAGGPPPFDPDAWTSEESVGRRVGGDFELEFEEGEWRIEAESPEAAWAFVSRAIPPLKALAAQLDADRKEELADAWIEYYRGLRNADGTVSEPRAYLLTFGTRR